MNSRFASPDRLYGAQAVPRWLASLAFATVVAGAGVYVLLAQAPRPVEAAGFLTPVEDGAMEIAAYVPPTHPEYVVDGARAKVLFPDGSERVAEIAALAAGTAPLPHAQMLGDARLGTLVRMEFVDTRPATRETLVEGLPVKLQFEAR